MTGENVFHVTINDKSFTFTEQNAAYKFASLSAKAIGQAGVNPEETTDSGYSRSASTIKKRTDTRDLARLILGTPYTEIKIREL